MRPKKALRGDPHRCENCMHFEQHYVKYPGGAFVPCGCGHCKYPRMKCVQPNEICGDFFPEKKILPSQD